MRGAKGEERREKVERMQFEEFKERERERGGGGAIQLSLAGLSLLIKQIWRR